MVSIASNARETMTSVSDSDPPLQDHPLWGSDSSSKCSLHTAVSTGFHAVYIAVGTVCHRSLKEAIVHSLKDVASPGTVA